MPFFVVLIYMKTIFLSIVLLVSAYNCAQENLDLTYLAQTRGFFLQIEIHPSKLKVTHTRGGETKERELTQREQDELKDILAHTDFEKVKTTESTKSHSDAAAMANLSLTLDGEHREFDFDHGSPPKLLDSLVQKIISLSETME